MVTEKSCEWCGKPLAHEYTWGDARQVTEWERETYPERFEGETSKSDMNRTATESNYLYGRVIHSIQDLIDDIIHSGVPKNEVAGIITETITSTITGHIQETKADSCPEDLSWNALTREDDD